MADNENPIAKWLREKTGMEPGAPRKKSMKEIAIEREERGEEPQAETGVARDPSERKTKSAIERETEGMAPEDNGRSGRNAGDLGMSWDETFKKHIG